MLDQMTAVELYVRANEAAREAMLLRRKYGQHNRLLADVKQRDAAALRAMARERMIKG